MLANAHVVLSLMDGVLLRRFISKCTRRARFSRAKIFSIYDEVPAARDHNETAIFSKLMQ
jgi:hypothetical protein